MFFQFRVNTEQRDLLRFLWWDNENLEGDPVEFRMKVHLFGASSSPACANYGLKQAAIDNEETCGLKAADFIRNDFYVDDGLKSVSTVKDAVKLIQESQQICNNAGLKLHKFTSNDREVLASIPIDDRAQGIKNLDLFHCDLPVERALGIHWCVESDTFNFRITLQDKPLTRRGILSTVSSIYDPLGFLAPVLLVGKQILQLLCKDHAGWDTELPEELRIRWEKWRSDLINLEKLQIPRCYKPDDFGDLKSVEIHHFSDASTTGYGQCSYLRPMDDCDNVYCSLLMGKARVAPLRPVTIPRLELTAALISVKVSSLLRRELQYEDIQEVFWTDSKIVLGYLSNDIRRFNVFVANRVQQIRNQTDPNQWRYVNTEVNPADEASRGISAEEFVSNSRWLHGPDFLWNKETPPHTLPQEDLKLRSDDPEVKHAKVLTTLSDTPSQPSLLERLEHFSDWYKAKRAVSVCLRLKTKLKNRDAKPLPDFTKRSAYVPSTVGELADAETQVIRLVQDTSFKKEMDILHSLPNKTVNKRGEKHLRGMRRKSTLYKLDPFLDDNGVLRVGGRIRTSSHPDKLKHPVILPKKHHITRLIIRHFHEREQHQGRGITCNAIRSGGFWIIGGRSEVSRIISKCTTCRKFRAQTMTQKMYDLPGERVEPAPPFTNCGVDYFGPWTIKDGRKLVIRYGVIFTCLSSRAVHIETAISLSSDSFINALRRFIAIRGPIRQLRSDQGTNFVGASREKEAVLEMGHNRIKQYLLSENCDYFEFKMNPPAASHMGGAWERQIRTIRSVLSSLMKQSGEQLDDESFRTLMCEVSAIINCRPLTTDNLNDALYPEPLTPNHILTMKSKVILSPPGNFTQEGLYCRKRWRRVQHLANSFWSRWKKEYLQQLQTRKKWTQTKRNMQVGDVVIIKDSHLPRNKWQLARVEETFLSSDGHVRTAKLLIADSQLDTQGKRVKPVMRLQRPVHKLILLLENE